MQMSSPPSTDLMWWILAKLTCECERLINQKGIKTKKKKKKNIKIGRKIKQRCRLRFKIFRLVFSLKSHFPSPCVAAIIVTFISKRNVLLLLFIYFFFFNIL
jgi:hypothetical protein